MRKYRGLLFILASLVTLCGGGVALASDISGADYYGTIRITNNGTAATGVSVNVTIGIDDLIASGIIGANASDIALRTNGNADTPFMPARNGNSSVFSVPSISDNSNIDYVLYTGVSGGELMYFPDTAGATVSDSPTIEPGGNFTQSITGYFDASAAGNITSKGTDYRLYGDGSGNITVNMTGSGTYLTVDGNGDYTNISNATPAVAHNLNVDDAVGTPDDAATTVETSNAAQQKDAYTLTDYSGGYNIDRVIVHFRYRWTTTSGSAQPYLRLNGAETTGTQVTGAVDGTWYSYSETLARPGGGQWNDADLDNLQVAIGMSNTGAGWSYLTQVYVELQTDAIAASGITSGERVIKYEQQPTLKFDGVNDIVTIPHQAAIGTLGAFSVEAWFSTNTSSKDQTILSKYPGSNNGNWLLALRSGNTLQFSIIGTQSADQLNAIVNNVTYNNTGWHHIIGVWNGTNAAGNTYIYIDGANQTLGTDGLAGNGADSWGVTPDIEIGRFYSDNSRCFSGDIFGVRYYNRALTSAEVLNRYNGIEITGGPTASWPLSDGSGTVALDEESVSNGTISGATWGNYAGRLYVDSALKDIGDNKAINNNATDLIFFTNFVMPYIETCNVTVNSTLVGDWSWQYADTFTDGSGYGHTMTPTFRTTSSDADISAELIDFGPISLSESTGNVSESWPTVMASPPSEPSTSFSENTTPGFFFAGFVDSIWTAFVEDYIPQSFFWFNFSFFWIMAVSIGSYSFFAGNNKEALFVKIFATLAIMIFFALPGINVYGLFVPLYYGFFSVGAIMLRNNYGW